VLWVALHGTVVELCVELIVLGAIVAVGAVLRPLAAAETTFTSLGAVLFTTACFMVQRYVQRQRVLVAEQLSLTATVEAERHQLHVILGCIEEGVALGDQSRRLLYVNESYTRMLHLPPLKAAEITREAVGQQLESLSDDPESVREKFKQLGSEPGRASAEFDLERPTPHTLAVTVSPTELAAGPGFVVVWRDITAAKQMQTALEHEARTDVLTGLANRRALEAELKREVARARRAGAPLSLAMFDVDRFKATNDSYGHAVGDAVLRSLASLLFGAARLTDTVGRWGGEEFMVVLPGPLEGASIFCERAREAIERFDFPTVGRVTVSVGIATLLPDEKIETTIARADENLYEAKRTGRNRVVAS
jgi:diguanylate cyclase (GGDEF)-like protein